MSEPEGHPAVPEDVLRRLRAVCLRLPEAVEEQAWTGTRWCVGKKTFAHVVQVADGWPPVYAREAGTDGPASVLTFRSSGDELEALRNVGPPFFKPPWAPAVAGLVIGGDGHQADWDDVAALVTDSFRLLAPKRLTT